LNVVDAVLHQARMNPGGLAICAPGAKIESVSYATLARVINNIGRRALWEGLRRGDLVALALKDAVLQFAVALALARVGIVTITPPASGLPPTLRVAAVIADGAVDFEHAARALAANFGWMDGDGEPLADPNLYRTQDGDICRIELGRDETRAVALSHNLLIRRTDAVQRAGSLEGSRLYCDLASGSARIFELLLHTLSRGGTIFFGDDPEQVAQAFGLYRIRAIFAGPDRLVTYLRFLEARDDVQHRFDRVCFDGPVSVEVSERIRMRMGSLLYSSYWTVESGTIAVAPMHRVGHVPGAVGWEVPGAKVEIADRSGKPMPAGEQGRVRVRSPYATQSFLGEGVAPQNDGYLDTGDAGLLTDDRLLVILGRAEARC
jgi:acyl-coenzyme A synthetase/AMP-(fatty) acid ligase